MRTSCLHFPNLIFIFLPRTAMYSPAINSPPCHLTPTIVSFFLRMSFDIHPTPTPADPTPIPHPSPILFFPLLHFLTPSLTSTCIKQTNPFLDQKQLIPAYRQSYQSITPCIITCTTSHACLMMTMNTHYSYTICLILKHHAY